MNLQLRTIGVAIAVLVGSFVFVGQLTADPLRNASHGVEVESDLSEIASSSSFDETDRFVLRDGSVITVDYSSMRVTVEMGRRGPEMNESFVEDDFGGIYWDWGQVVPRSDGSWFYEDWLGEGYQSVAVPLGAL